MKRTWKSFSDFFEKYALILHIPLAMLLVLVNESLSRHSLIEGFGFITNHTGAFLYNSFIIYVILLPAEVRREREVDAHRTLVGSEGRERD